MKILLFVLLFFTFANLVSAQPIFVSLKGERAITKVKDIKKEEVNIPERGKPCGEYFLYEEIKDQDGTFEHIISFKVPVGDQEYTSITMGFAKMPREHLIIKPDDKIKAPTAEWDGAITSHNGLRSGGFIIRISPKDLRAANCLSASP